MRALIMAGGAGSRLNLGEKPLILINNQPMIRYIINAFTAAGCTVVVATSPKTPMTQNWCRANGIDSYDTGGMDYITDMIEAVTVLEETHPLFISVSDIPCIEKDIIDKVCDAYISSGKNACSTWVPTDIVTHCKGDLAYKTKIRDTLSCPTGLNILQGSLISEPQDELQLIINDPRLLINVNTPTDRNAAEEFLRKQGRE